MAALRLRYCIVVYLLILLKNVKPSPGPLPFEALFVLIMYLLYFI